MNLSIAKSASVLFGSLAFNILAGLSLILSLAGVAVFSLPEPVFRVPARLFWLSPDGNTLATMIVVKEKQALVFQFWTLSDKALTYSITLNAADHGNLAPSLCFSGDNKTAAILFEGHRVFVCDYANQRSIQYANLELPTWSFAFFNDRGRLIARSFDGILWDVASQHKVGEIDLPLEWDCKSQVENFVRLTIRKGNEEKAIIVDGRNGKTVAILPLPCSPEPVFCITRTGSAVGYVDTKNVFHLITTGTDSESRLTLDSSPVFVEVSPSRKLLAVGYESPGPLCWLLQQVGLLVDDLPPQSVSLIDVDSGKEVMRLPGRSGQALNTVFADNDTIATTYDYARETVLVWQLPVERCWQYYAALTAAIVCGVFLCGSVFSMLKRKCGARKVT